MTIVSRETTALLDSYAALVRKWNPHINLVAAATLDDLFSRHIADCQQLAALSQSAQGSWIDLGSGAGFPGLVIAIERPDLAVTLVESDQRKATFLRTVVRELGLPNIRVLTARIEAAEPADADHVSARALAPLPLLMSYVHRHLRPDGTAWLMKGRNWMSEVEEARKMWDFKLQSQPSATDPEAAILQIKEIRHA